MTNDTTATQENPLLQAIWVIRKLTESRVGSDQEKREQLAEARTKAREFLSGICEECHEIPAYGSGRDGECQTCNGRNWIPSLRATLAAKTAELVRVQEEWVDRVNELASLKEERDALQNYINEQLKNHRREVQFVREKWDAERTRAEAAEAALKIAVTGIIEIQQDAIRNHSNSYDATELLAAIDAAIASKKD